MGRNRKRRTALLLARPQLWIIAVAVLLGFGWMSQLFDASGLAAAQTRHFVQPGRNPAGIPTIPSSQSPNSFQATNDSTNGAVDCTAVPCLALTFDDGPDPITTPTILSALEQAQAHATFFVVGSRAITMPSIVQRIYRDGDEIGNHTWTHPDLTTLSADQVLAQINQTQLAVVDADVPAPTLFRPPYGAVNDMVKREVRMPIIMWNDDPDDWQSLNAQQIIASAEVQAKPGAIIDMHDIYVSTAQAVPQLVSDLKQHYQLVTVSQLLNLQPGERGEFFGR